MTATEGVKAALEKKITDTTGVATKKSEEADPGEVAVTAAPETAEAAAEASEPEESVATPPETRRDVCRNTVMIDRVYKDGAVITRRESDEEIIEVRAYPREVPLGSVDYGCKMTLNLGDFESVSITVGVQLPTTVEELDEAYDAAKTFVDGRLNKEVSNVREYRERKRKKA